MAARTYDLSVTTQGPLYPPSEILDENGDFVVIGNINRESTSTDTVMRWGSAVVSRDTAVPPFGERIPHTVIREITPDLDGDTELVLYTLDLPLPANNYPMLFAPEQYPDAGEIERPSYPLHAVPIPDARPEDGIRHRDPITLGQWCGATGTVHVETTGDTATFTFELAGLIPDSLYTVMSLRQYDLDPVHGPTRPGPLGIPNVFMADATGTARYTATLPDPFPEHGNRVINVVVLWMSYQMNYGGAIGRFGLGGDIHAQLKLTGPSFGEFVTS